MDRPNFPLVTDEDNLPLTGAQSGVSDPTVYAKLFCPWGRGTWWLLEYDPDHRIAFCFAYLGDEWCAELGDVSIDELESVHGPIGLTIERDCYFTPKPLSQALADHGLYQAASNFKPQP